MTVPSSVHSRSEGSRVLDWQKDVARSTANRAPREPPSTTRIIVNNITTPTIVVSHPVSQPKEDYEISTRAIIGTILGASAGAAVAYAMVKGEHEDREAQEQVKRVSETAIIVRPPLADVRNYQPQRTSIYDRDRARSHHTITGPRVETLVSSSHGHRHHEPHSDELRSITPATRSQRGQTIVQTSNGTKIIAGSTHSRGSYASSPSKREKYSNSAAGFPLPESRASTLISKYDTVVPNDSVSQVSTKRPKDYERSSHHHHSSKSASSHRRRDSHTSSRTPKPKGSRVGGRRDSIMAFPIASSSRSDSGH